MRAIASIFLVLTLFLIGDCSSFPEYTLSEQSPPINAKRKARLLSGFFGLDNAIPIQAMGIWSEAPGKDGLPLVISHEIDPLTLDSRDFQITTKQNQILSASFAMFRPAMEAFELRTILLLGEFGNYPDNEPVEVKIIGDLFTRDGQNLKGQKIKVTPLSEGPFLVYSEYFRFGSGYPYHANLRGKDCPLSETAMIVRAVWSGGVRASDGQELGERELSKFKVTFIENGKNHLVSPFKLADLDDNDNNIDLCLSQKGIPISIEVEENTAIDPRGDKNPKTRVNIESRW